jgi:hypothetical protein
MATRDCSFEYFLHAHKNADEPATSLQLRQNSNSSFLLVVLRTAVVIVFSCLLHAYCKLLVVSFMAVVIRFNKQFLDDFSDE